MVLHPGAGKTTSITEYIAWAIMCDRNFRSMVIRVNSDEAEKNVSQVGGRLEHENYHAWIDAMEYQGDVPIICPVCQYGGMDGYAPQVRGKSHRVGEKWRADALTVSGRTAGDKEATVEAYGANTSIAGVRSDLIVLDDAQSPVKFRTGGEAYTEDMFDWFREDVLGRLYDQQKLVVIGNRLGSQDFVGRLINEYGGDPDDPQPDDWKVVYYPAVLSDVTKKVLVPELWTYDALMRKRREVGEQIWAFQWMQQNVDESDAHFTKDQMDACKDFDLALGDMPPADSVVVIGVDPAVTGFCAMWVEAVNPKTGVRTLVDYLNEKNMRTQEKIASTAASLCATYNARICVVETNNIQTTIYEAIRTATRGMGVRMVDFKTISATGHSVTNADFDITGISTLMSDRMIKLPYADSADNRKRMDFLMAQFQLWRPKPPGSGGKGWRLKRDIVMSALFAESEARKVVKRGVIKKVLTSARVPPHVQRRWDARHGGPSALDDDGVLISDG
jgi:hypothetical protein